MEFVCVRQDMSKLQVNVKFLLPIQILQKHHHAMSLLIGMINNSDVCLVLQVVLVVSLAMNVQVASQVFTWISHHLYVYRHVEMVKDLLLIVMMAITSMEMDAVMIVRSS